MTLCPLPKVLLSCATVVLLLSGTVAAGSGADPQQLLTLARAKVEAGRAAEAVDLYRRALTALPADPTIPRELARLLASREETRADAAKVYAEAVKRAPRDAALAVERATFLTASGDAVNAVLEYRRAVELSPDNAAAVSGYVQQVSRMGVAPVQIHNSLKQLQASRGDYATRLLLAELYRSEGRYGDALTHYKLAQNHPGSRKLALRGTAEAWLALGYYERAALTFAQAPAGDDLGHLLADRARVHNESGRPEEALKLLRTYLSEVEKEPTALDALAEAYRAAGEKALERDALEKALKLGSEATTLTLQKLARVCHEAGDAKAARRYVEQLLLREKHNAVGTALREMLTAPPPPSAGAPTEATPTRRGGAERDKAETALFLDQPARATTHLRAALVQWPDSPWLLFALGESLLRAGDAEGAKNAFERLVAQSGSHPDAPFGHPDALIGLARAESLRNKADRALYLYQTALRLDPNNFRALLGQVDALQQMKQEERAFLILNDLARRAPENAEVVARLSRVALTFGRSLRPASAAAAPKATTPSGASPRVETGQKGGLEPLLGVGDVVRVSVAGTAQPRTVQVNESGLLPLPFLKQPVNARCLTERELAKVIAEQGASQLSGRKVEVSIVEYRRTPLIVAGAVYLPGSFNVRSPLTMQEGLMLAAGVTPRAGQVAYVVRGVGECSARRHGAGAETIEAYDRLEAEEGRVKLARPLGVGDILFVPDKDTVFISGAVARPGSLSAGGSLTLLKAIKLLGGTAADARRDKISLERPLPGGTTRRQFAADLNEIEAGRRGDILLQPGDVVQVPGVGGGAPEERLFTELIRRTALKGQQQPSAPRGYVTQKSSPAGNP